eukprot:520658_1
MGTADSAIFISAVEVLSRPDKTEYFSDVSSLSKDTCTVAKVIETQLFGNQWHYSSIDIRFWVRDVDKSKSPPSKHERIPWSLIGTTIFTTGCFYIFYLTVFRYCRYDSWYTFPMISFCGCHAEEEPFFRTTFWFAGIGQFMAQMTITNTQLYKQFLIHSPSILRQQSKFWLALHAFSSSMVGFFPLTTQQCIDSLSYVNNPGIALESDPAALPHYLFASIAGGGGVLGAIIGLFVYYYAFKHAECNDLQRTIGIQTLKRFFVFRVICTVLMILGLMGFCLIPPLGMYYNGYLTHTVANTMSLCEWVICIPLGLYDGCISLENYYVVQCMEQNGGSMKKKE